MIQQPERAIPSHDEGDPIPTLRIDATSEVSWGGTLPDGSVYRDPLQSISLEIGYPDRDRPLLEDGQPNLIFRSYGSPLAEATEEPNVLARWTRDNPQGVIHFAIPKLSKSIKGWDADEILVRKTLAFDPGDPRLELANGGSVLIVEQRTREHSLKMGAGEVGYVIGNFTLAEHIPNGAISIELTWHIGGRTERRLITKENQANLPWQLFSDKYFDESTMTYELGAIAVGPRFDDESIHWGTSTPVRVPLPAGRLKDLGTVRLTLPPPPGDKVERIKSFIHDFGS